MKVLLINASPKDYGATQEIVKTVEGALAYAPCIGCKRCYETGDCFQSDDVQALLAKMDESDAVLMVCPSWWADVPSQFKALIDRCTPYADTAPDNGHFALRKGIRCYGIALRAGSRTGECEHILACIEHYCGHMGLKYAGGLSLTGIDNKADVQKHKERITKTVQAWFVP